MQPTSPVLSFESQQGCKAEEEIFLSAKHIPFGRKFTVASFDGGGVRGIIPITIMHEISKRAGLEPHEFIDMGIGTSTGGLLCASYLGHKNDKPFFKASDLSSFWKKKMGEVFPNTCIFPFSETDGIFWVKHSAAGLEKVLHEITDDSMDIKSNMSSPITIPSFNATKGKPFYFRSIDVEKSLDKSIYKVFNVLRATTAAPGYLPAAKITINNEDHAFLDGGLVNNNPSLVGYLEAQNLAGSRSIQLLSFGTGEVDYNVSYKRLTHAGFLAVASTVFNGMFASMESHPDQILKNTLKDNYFRFQLYDIDSKHAGLDEVSSVSYFENKTVEWIQDNDEALLEPVCARLKPKLDSQDPYAKALEYY